MDLISPHIQCFQGQLPISAYQEVRPGRKSARSTPGPLEGKKNMKKLIVIVIALLFIAANSAIGTETHKMEQGKPDIKTIYFILGCLDEYLGRTIVEKEADVVEHFYSSEVQASQVFEKYLKRLVSEENINTQIRKEVQTDGGHILFHSPELYQRINSMYTYDFNKSSQRVSKNPGGPWVRAVKTFVSINIFNEQDKTAKLSYLAGAYARYGNRFDDNDFGFNTANASHKMDLIEELLKEFGCREVTHEMSDPEAIPISHTVIFVASPEIKKLFDSVSKEINGRDQVGRWVVK